MFFYWTPGMPLILSVLLAVASLFVFYCLMKSIRSAAGSMPNDDSMNEPDCDTDGGSWRCPKPNCRVMNTSRARYCRMCGTARGGHRAGFGL